MAFLFQIISPLGTVRFSKNEQDSTITIAQIVGLVAFRRAKAGSLRSVWWLSHSSSCVRSKQARWDPQTNGNAYLNMLSSVVLRRHREFCGFSLLPLGLLNTKSSSWEPLSANYDSQHGLPRCREQSLFRSEHTHNLEDQVIYSLPFSTDNLSGITCQSAWSDMAASKISV